MNLNSPLPAPVVSLDIIVQDPEGRFLLGGLAHRWTDNGRYLWGLPGREVMFGEDMHVATQRCLKKDLDLSVISARAVSVNSNFAFGNHFVSVGVLANVVGSITNRHPEDWTTWEWFDPSALPKQLFPSADQTLLSYTRGKVSLDFVE